MRRFVFIVLITFVIAGLITGCKKKEEQPVPKAEQIPAVPLQTPMGQAPTGQTPMGQTPMGQTPMGQTPMGQTPMGQMPAQPGMSPHGDSAGMTPKVEKAIVVPASVKGKWSKVILVVGDKVSKKTDEYTVNLKSDFKLPNSNLKIAVGEFLPDFKITGDAITSGSNELINPAVRIEIFEGEKSIFKGWLYEKFPAIHPFEHPKYAIMLKKGLK